MKKTLKAYLHYNTSKYSKDYEVWPRLMPYNEELIFIAEKEVEFDVPDDFDPRSTQIKALVEKRQEAVTAFHETNTEILRQIQELQDLSEDPQIYEKLTQSLAPSIWEMDNVKKGVLCMLFGGNSVRIKRGTAQRQMEHDDDDSFVCRND